MGAVNVNIQTGGLNRPSASFDKFAGLFVSVDALPSSGGGWADNEVVKINKVQDLADYGITAESVNFYHRLVYYHASEVFRLEPQATLYVQLSTSEVLADIIEAFRVADSNMRRIGFVFTTATLSAAVADSLQTALESAFTTEDFSLRSVACWKKDAGDALPDFTSGTTNRRVMVDISQDLTTGGIAKGIYDSIGVCGGVGTTLGQQLRLPVHQRQSWKEYPVNGAGNWLELGDVNGDSVEGKTKTELLAYDTQGLSLITRQRGIEGAYLQNARMAIKTSDDYAVMTHGAVIDKAISLVYTALTPKIDAPTPVETSTGFIQKEAAATLERIAYNAINTNMVLNRSSIDVEVSLDANNELPARTVVIDPIQDITDDELTVGVQISPVGASNIITINIGLSSVIQ